MSLVFFSAAWHCLPSHLKEQAFILLTTFSCLMFFLSSGERVRMGFSRAANQYLLCWMVYLVAPLSASPPRGLPWPLFGDAIDVIASTCGRLRVLLPHVHDLKRLLTRSGAGWLRLRLTLLSINGGVLPWQLRQIAFCRDLEGRKNQEKGRVL